jgi:hypothetical protein
MFIDMNIGSFHLTFDIFLIVPILLFALPVLIGVLLFRSKLPKQKKVLFFLLTILIFGVLIALALFIPPYFILLK